MLVSGRVTLQKIYLKTKEVTLPEANIAAGRKLPQKESSLPTISFQVLC